MTGVVATPIDCALSNRALLTIFLIAFVIRLLNALWMVAEPNLVLTEDAGYYWRGAQAWLDQGVLTHMSRPGVYIAQTERVPLYHLFLVPFRWVFGDNLLPALIGQAAISAFTCAIIAKFVGMLGPVVGVLGGLLAAFWPNLIIHAGMTLGDTLFLFFVTLLLLYCAKYLRGAQIRDAAIAGFLCGLATMTRPVAQFLPFALFVVALLIARGHGKSWKSSFVASAMLLTLAITPAIPLLTRNFLKYDTLQLTSQTGTHLLGWIASAKGVQLDGRSFVSVNAEINLEFEAHASSKNINLDELDPFARSRERTSFALERLKDIPPFLLLRIWLQNAGINLSVPAILGDPRVRKLKNISFYNLESDSFVEKVSTFLISSPKGYLIWVIGGGAFAAVSLILQMAGFFLLIRKKHFLALFAFLFIFYFLLLNGPVSLPKYRLPFEPVLIAFQALAVQRILKFFRSRHTCF